MDHGAEMIAALTAALRAAKAVLRDVEWRGDTGWDCPSCKGHEPVDRYAAEPWEGHRLGCRLLAILDGEIPVEAEATEVSDR